MQTISVRIDQVEVEKTVIMTSEIYQCSIKQFSSNFEVKILSSNYNHKDVIQQIRFSKDKLRNHGIHMQKDIRGHGLKTVFILTCNS